MTKLDEFLSLAEGPIQVQRVPVAQNKEMIVRRLLVEDLPAIEEAMGEKKSTADKMKGLLVLTLCDEDGNKIIVTKEHMERLDKIPLAILRSLFTVAAKINGLSEDDEGN